jgi:hypothetical protein
MSDQICHKGTKPAFIAYFGIYVLDLDDENQYALFFTLVLLKHMSTEIWNLLSSLETAEL